jgi:putative inorganic carbon (hco3(-)) transporter
VYILQIAFMIVALLAIILWFLGGYQQIQAKDDRPSLPAILLVSWLIASVIFSAYFYVLRFAGFFDITIERLLFVMVILFLVAGLFQGKVHFQKNLSIEMTMGVFALVCIISMIRVGFVAVAPEFASPWYAFITGYFFPFIVFVFAKNYISSEQDVKLIFQTLFYFGIYLSVTAVFEFTDLRQFVFPRFINDPEIGVNIDRARGPFVNAGFNGFGILIGFISGLHLLEKKSGLTRVFYLASLLLFFPAVFFTNTRMVYIGMLITLFIFLAWYKTSFSKWKLISLPLAIVLIVGIANSPRLLSPERRTGGVLQLQEVDIRIALLKKSYFMFLEQPFTGVGLAQFQPSSIRSYRGPIYVIEEEAASQLQHNHLLGIASELGLPGFLAYLTLIILILRRIQQLAGRLPGTGIMGNNLRITIFAIWCVFLEIGMFLEPSNNIFMNAIAFLFAGLADGMYARSLEPVLASQSPVRMLQPPMRIMNSHV